MDPMRAAPHLVMTFLWVTLSTTMISSCCSSTSEVTTCRPPYEPPAARDGAADLPLSDGSDQACPAQGKIRFAQGQGCQNDGSVELCLPQGDAAVLAQARAIAADLSCAPGGGRAKCDPALELLCLLPTVVGGRCVALHGALTDAAWGQVCALAALPAVREIVPTFFE